MPFAAPRLNAGAEGQARSSTQRDYEQRRGSARRRGYGSAWDRAARAYRARHPLCLGCQAVGRTVVCTLVDHVIPHKGDELLFWDELNWQPACGWHHDVVKQQLERLYRAGKISADYLRLDGEVAVDLTLRLDPKG